MTNIPAKDLLSTFETLLARRLTDSEPYSMDKTDVFLIHGCLPKERPALYDQLWAVVGQYTKIRVEVDWAKRFKPKNLFSSEELFNRVDTYLQECLQKGDTHKDAPLTWRSQPIVPVGVVFLLHHDLVHLVDHRLREIFSNADLQGRYIWIIFSQRNFAQNHPISRHGTFIGYCDDHRFRRPICFTDLSSSQEGRDQHHISKSRNRQGTVSPARFSGPAGKVEQEMQNERDNAPNTTPLRLEILKAIAAREGQEKFRQQMISAFKGKCLVTGDAVEPVLEAAHIEPYSEVPNHESWNGLLLRSDIHTLFDKYLLTFLPIQGRVCKILLHSKLRRKPEYKHLHLRIVQLPDDQDVENRRRQLKNHRKSCAITL